MLSFLHRIKARFGVKQPLIELSRVVKVETVKVLPLHKRVRLNTITVTRTTRLLMLPLFVVALMATQAQHALAWTGATLPPSCSTNLAAWDWPRSIQKGTVWNVYTPSTGIDQTGQAMKSNFNYSTSSYVVLKTAGSSTDTELIYIANTEGQKITFFIDSTDGHYKFQAQGGVLLGSIVDKPKPQYSNNDYYQIVQGTGSTSTNIDVTPTCMDAKNVSYGSSWNLGSISGNLDYTQSSNTCGLTEVSCWIHQAFTGVQNTLVSAFQAIAGFIANIFMPDAATVQSDFTAFQTFMNNKLGFLLYPFTFMVDLFNGFSSSANAWCTDSSCTKDFGTLFGAHFNINLTQVKTTMPTFWTWFTGMMRGLLVLGLLIAVREKYKSITHK